MKQVKMVVATLLIGSSVSIAFAASGDTIFNGAFLEISVGIKPYAANLPQQQVSSAMTLPEAQTKLYGARDTLQNTYNALRKKHSNIWKDSQDPTKSFFKTVDEVFLSMTGGKQDRTGFCGASYLINGDNEDIKLHTLCYQQGSSSEMINLLIPSGDYNYLDEFTTEANNALTWIVNNKTALSAYLQTPDDYVKGSEDENLAISKLKEQKETVDPAALIFEGAPLLSGSKVVFNQKSSSDELLKKAFGAVPLENLPLSINGFDTGQLLGIIYQAFGEDELDAFSYKNFKGKKLYGVPALKIWTAEHHQDLNRILNQHWIGTTIPLQNSSVWAVQELRIKNHINPEEIAVLTPDAVYVNPAFYSQFMDKFRANKMALTGDEIADAISNLQDELHGDLQSIRKAINTSGQLSDARLQEISSKMGNLNGIKNVGWTLAFLQAANLLK